MNQVLITVSRKKYVKNPDGDDRAVIDVDRGTAPVGQKQAEPVSTEGYNSREFDRRGLHGLDAMVERMPGMTRAQRDRDRSFPRETNQPLQHPAMQRPLPGRGEVRAPFSSRQKKARSKARLEAARSLPAAQFRAQRQLMTDPQTWSRINDQLSEHAGDPTQLSESDRKLLGQIDRSIQAAERHNTRGHVIYTNVQMPHFINGSNIDAWSEHTFTPGATVAFDRYTVGTHQMHETNALAGDDPERTVVCEIETRRGAYLGHSDSQDDTAHLLPRGMHLQVVGVSREAFRAPNGTTGNRMVLQLRDITPDTTQGERA